MKDNCVGVVSLGCSKNRVDTEHMLALLRAAGFTFTEHPDGADILIVNTCGFIQSAKEESIEQILTLARHKADRCHTLVVTGCLSERYREELLEEMPEVDIFLGVREYEKLPALLRLRLGESDAQTAYGVSGESTAARMLTTPPHMAYLRISDGCDNRCSYCAIPLIRGGHAERPIDELLREARALVDGGVQELCVIAQDTTRYGPGLGALLGGLDAIDGLRWIRVLYAYPAGLTQEMLAALTGLEKVVHYLDLPIQHASDELLSRMNRRGGRAAIERAVKALRSADENYILRTSAMVGFPGETEAHFDELMAFLGEMRFDRVGAFTFSREEGTLAAEMSDQVDPDTAAARLDRLMRAQAEISASRQQKRLGSVVDVLIEGHDGRHCIGRSYAEAPEVDGKVIFSGEGAAGQWRRVKLTRFDAYDSWGEEYIESGK